MFSSSEEMSVSRQQQQQHTEQKGEENKTFKNVPHFEQNLKIFKNKNVDKMYTFTVWCST